MNDKINKHCCKVIFSGHYKNRCSRKAKVWVDGKGYCAQHDPKAVKKRQEERTARWDVERDRGRLVGNLEKERNSMGKKVVELYKAGIPFPDDVLVHIKRIIEMEEELKKLKL